MVSSDQLLQSALDRIRAIDTIELPAVEEKLRKTKAGQEAEALALERAELDAAARQYILAVYEPGEGYESDAWLATHVQGHTRKWNVDKLRDKLTRGQFKRVINEVVDKTKLDELVRSGAVTSEDIEEALEEKPNAPYVLITPRDGSSITDEASALAAKLGL